MWKATSWLGPEQPDAPHVRLEISESVPEENNMLLEVDPNPDPPPPPSTTVGFLCFGIHLQEALYVDPEVRKVLRVYLYNEMQRRYPGCTKK